MRKKDLSFVAMVTATFGLAAWMIHCQPVAAILVAGLSCLAVAWPLWLFRRLQNQLQAACARLQNEARSWARISLRLDTQALPLPELGGVRVSADFAAEILDEIATRRPVVVAEFGCGASTIIAAGALRKNGAGKLRSFDHEAQFATETQTELERRGLTAWATVSHAPLRASGVHPERLTYDPAPLSALHQVDLMIIDGPPGWLPGAHRGEVLETLAHRLAPGASILFDDGNRPEVTRFVREWIASHPDWTAEHLNLEKGAWRLNAPRPRPA